MLHCSNVLLVQIRNLIAKRVNVVIRRSSIDDDGIRLFFTANMSDYILIDVKSVDPKER